MKKIVFFLWLLISALVIFTGCGNNVNGTWYDTTDPDGDKLILAKDKMFSCGDFTGTWSIENDVLILSSANVWYESENMMINKYDGETALIDSDNVVWLKDYEKALALYEEAEAQKQAKLEKEKKEKEQAERAEMEQKISKISENVIGEYTGVSVLKGPDTLVINSDYTYQYNGGWGYEDQWQTGRCVIKEDYSDGTIDIEFVPSLSSDSLIQYFDGNNNPFFTDAYLEWDENDSIVYLRGSALGPYHATKFYKE